MAMVRIDSPWKLTCDYLLFGTLWIGLSDGLVAYLTDTAAKSWLIDSLKGIAFIGITGGFIYVLSTRLVGRHLAAEAALRESEARWQAALSSAGDGMWDIDLTAGSAYFSRQAVELFGYAPAEIRPLASEILERLHPDDESLLRQRIEEHALGGTPALRCELRLRCKDGSYKWILGRGRIVSRDEAGRPRRMLGVVTDISARKEAERRMADALALNEMVLRSSPLGIATFLESGEIESVNPALERMVGAPPGRLANLNFRTRESWVHSGLRTAAEQALASGQEVELTTEVLTAFGRRIWVEARMVPFRHRGRTRLLAMFSDETKGRQALASLHILRAGLEAMPNGIVITDEEGIIQWVNPGFTALTGYTRDEAIGRNPRILKSTRQSGEFYAKLWATITEGQVWAGELQNQRKDGSVYAEYMTIAPVRDSTGRIGHFVAIKQDLTPIKQLEQQLARTQRLESIGLLASGIAHDLNNMLSPIMLSIGLIRTQHGDPETRSHLDVMETAVQRGAGVVRQVLTFARGLDGERSRVEPRHLLKELARFLEETLPRDIAVTVEIHPGTYSLLGDATQLHQVLLNLAINARDAMPGGGRLRMSARNHHEPEPPVAGPRLADELRPGDYVALTVADTGTGIPPEVLEHIFEPFYTTKPRGKGTGLGLSTVYGIVRSHGGAVRVRTAPGQGAEFTVLLPAVLELAPPVAPAPAAPVLAGAGRTVLIADDEPGIRTALVRILTQHGFRCVAAVDGHDGLRRFRSAPERYAAAVLDVMMPGMNGVALAREIRRLAPHLPVMLSSGLSHEAPQEDTRQAMAELGLRTLLNKPYGEAEFVAALAAELAPPGRAG